MRSSLQHCPGGLQVSAVFTAGRPREGLCLMSNQVTWPEAAFVGDDKPYAKSTNGLASFNGRDGAVDPKPSTTRFSMSTRAPEIIPSSRSLQTNADDATASPTAGTAPIGYTELVGSRLFRVIQQRLNGNVSFARTWAEYETGFGNDYNFWVGLSILHKHTMNQPRNCRIEATLWNGTVFVSEFSGFQVNNQSTNYSLSATSVDNSWSNSTCCALADPDAQFSAADVDNDLVANQFLSKDVCGGAGWWFTRKGSVCGNLNGVYPTDSTAVGSELLQWSNKIGGACISQTLKRCRIMLEADTSAVASPAASVIYRV